MNRAEFWATKPTLPSYHSVTFSHPAFDWPIRLVANVFKPVTLGGIEHTPAPMQIEPPQVSSDGQPTLRLSFPRQVVGREFKRQLKRIAALASRDPITVHYAVWLGDTATPATTWTLYASDSSGIVIGANTVQVTAGLDNPMRRAVAPIYTPDVFTGLKNA